MTADRPAATDTAALREALARGIWEAANGKSSHLGWDDKYVSERYGRRYREYADTLLSGPLAALVAERDRLAAQVTQIRDEITYRDSRGVEQIAVNRLRAIVEPT